MKRSMEHGRGIRGLDRHGWIRLARTAIQNVIETQLAAPRIELEARLWEHPWEEPGTGRRAHLFPHILNEAIRDLTAEGHIQPYQHVTKGGTTSDLLIPGNLQGRATYVERAARRKGMLYARFLRWSKTEFGPAGEAVVRASLADAQAQGHNYLPIAQGFGEVPTLGGVRVNGALDSGAWMLVTDPKTKLPALAHAALFEVKNRRLTLYPRHPEVHQLLHKAAILSAALPTQPIVPVLVCRRAHTWLFWMAKDLGFIVHDTRAQYLTLPEKTSVRMLDEVRAELALDDLRLVSTDSQPRIINLFAKTLPKQARPVALRWSTVGSTLLDHYKTLRDEGLQPWERTAALAALRTAADFALDDADLADGEPILTWALEEDPDDGPMY